MIIGRHHLVVARGVDGAGGEVFGREGFDAFDPAVGGLEVLEGLRERVFLRMAVE